MKIIFNCFVAREMKKQRLVQLIEDTIISREKLIDLGYQRSKALMLSILEYCGVLTKFFKAGESSKLENVQGFFIAHTFSFCRKLELLWTTGVTGILLSGT